MPGGRVTLETRDGVGLITLRRPDKLNALAGSMREQLAVRVAEAASSPGIGSLVVTGEGRAFCAGGDVATMAALQRADDVAGFRAILDAGAACVRALAAFPGLTVAAIHGVAAGAGLSLALHCDLRVATSESRLVASWGGIGLVPDWGATAVLPRFLGRARALRMVLSCEAIEAPRALELGLVDEISASGAVVDCALAMARDLGSPAATAAAVTRLVRRTGEAALNDCLAAETEAQIELFRNDVVAAKLAEFEARRQRREQPASDV